MKQNKRISLFLSKQIKFKKQYQTINAVIRDKQIRRKKKNLINLIAVSRNLSQQLAITKQNHELQCQSYQAKRSMLERQQLNSKAEYMKLLTRKHRLEVIQNKEINNIFASDLKKYLRGWAQNCRFQFLKSVGGPHNYRLARKCIWKMELAFYAIFRIDKICLLRHCTFYNQKCQLQTIMVCVRKNQKSSQISENRNYQYKLQIYSTNLQYFFIQRLITQDQLHLKLLDLQNNQSGNSNFIYIGAKRNNNIIYPNNPLKNILIFVRNKKIVFLDEYFKDIENVSKIQRVIKICKFQMDVLREKNKLQFFKCLKIRNIFQSIYNVPGYENLQLNVLLSIKKVETPKQFSNQQIIFSGQTNPKLDKNGKTSKNVQISYILTCQPIQSYDSNVMFVIQNQYLQNHNKDFLQNFVEIFQTKYMIQLDVKKIINRISINEQNNPGSKGSFRQQYKVTRTEKKTMPPQLVQVIDFSNKINLHKIIKSQAAIRMCLRVRQYRKTLSYLKSKEIFNFCCKIEGNIMISSYIQNKELMFFVQCLSLSAQKTKQQNRFLNYDSKYWKLAQQFIKSQTCAQISKKYLIWEIQQDIALYFDQSIVKYENQQQIINQMKPIKAYNRLKRLFIKAMLRGKIKRNILYLRKLQTQFAYLVIMIRRSAFLRDIAQIHLYHLKSKDKPTSNYRQNHYLNAENKLFNRAKNRIRKKPSFNLDPDAQMTPCIGIQNINNYFADEHDQQSKPRYTKICMHLQQAQNFINYMKNIQKLQKSVNNCLISNYRLQSNSKSIQNQFYITQNQFVLKPLHMQFLTGKYRFIQRFSQYCINHKDMQKQKNGMDINYDKFKQNNSSQIQHNFINKGRLKTLHLLKKSSSSIPMENSYINSRSQIDQQCIQITVLFYSLYRLSSKQTFYIQVFILTQNSTNSYFKSIHKQELSKKQISCSTHIFAYQFLQKWYRKELEFSKSLKQKNHGKMFKVQNKQINLKYHYQQIKQHEIDNLTNSRKIQRKQYQIIPNILDQNQQQIINA